MAVLVQCPECGKKLRVPDEKLDRLGRCPGCKAVFRLQAPAESQPSAPPPDSPADDNWLIASHDGNEYGPVSKAELDGWLAEGLVSVQCQPRRESESEWRSANLYRESKFRKPP